MQRPIQVALATEYQYQNTETTYVDARIRDGDLLHAAELWPEAEPLLRELQGRRDLAAAHHWRPV